ncbi:MAG TPA: CopD family protein [Tepidiformaceae bacterium]|nr:CopD family protein [Tepidiformaceae bacterium]
MPDDPQIWIQILLGYIHDLSIAVYLGGAVAMEFVLGPAQTSIPPAQAQVMGQKTSDRFLWLAWGSLILILVTGALRLERLDMLNVTWPFFESPLSLSESYGRTVGTMFVLWCVLAINGALVTFRFRPRLAGKMAPGTSAAQVTSNQAGRMAAATWIQRLTRADLAITVVVALLGASLKWGGLL